MTDGEVALVADEGDHPDRAYVGNHQHWVDPDDGVLADLKEGGYKSGATVFLWW